MAQSQFVDLAVSRGKFDREVVEFRELNDQYLKKGWFLVHADYPYAYVVLASSKTSPITVLTGISFDFTNYDVVPPSVKLVHPMTKEPYKNSELPTRLIRMDPTSDLSSNPPNLKLLPPLMQAHGPDDVPFLCMTGVREYHEHPAHSGDPWELHRSSGAGRLIRLVEIISRYGLEPITGLNVEMIPNVTFSAELPQ